MRLADGFRAMNLATRRSTAASKAFLVALAGPSGGRSHTKIS